MSSPNFYRVKKVGDMSPRFYTAKLKHIADIANFNFDYL